MRRGVLMIGLAAGLSAISAAQAFRSSSKLIRLPALSNLGSLQALSMSRATTIAAACLSRRPPPLHMFQSRSGEQFVPHLRREKQPDERAPRSWGSFIRALMEQLRLAIE
jgi:hypothetical protein